MLVGAGAAAVVCALLPPIRPWLALPFDQGYGIRQAIASLFRPEVFKYLLVQTGYGLVGFLLLLGLAWVLRLTVGTRPESA